MPQIESDVSPFTAEQRPESACSTQNKAKRANEIVFLLLVRDQEVGGSNPLAPTNFFNKLSDSSSSSWFDPEDQRGDACTNH